MFIFAHVRCIYRPAEEKYDDAGHRYLSVLSCVCASVHVVGGSLASSVSLRRASQAAAPGTGQKRKLWLLVIPVTTFCLGTWQVFRLQWKLDLIADLERRTKKEVINIPLE